MFLFEFPAVGLFDMFVGWSVVVLVTLLVVVQRRDVRGTVVMDIQKKQKAKKQTSKRNKQRKNEKVK